VILAALVPFFVPDLKEKIIAFFHESAKQDNQSSEQSNAGDGQTGLQDSGVGSPSTTPTNQVEDKRPITNYGSKPALARLILYLREKGDPPIKGIWHAMPLSSALYQNRSFLSRSVGGWIFDFQDTQGKARVAKVNCWGEVSIENEAQENSDSFLGAINVAEIVLDNMDANTVVLNHGGEAKADGLGGWLMAVDVEGRGIRPAWAGSEWFIRKEGIIVMVDAQTGELYCPAGEQKMRPLNPEQKPAQLEWNGGFDENDPTAIMESSEHFYWWPRAYQDVEQRYVYNRTLLRRELKVETEKTNRNASSWLTSAILHNILGEWDQGVDDLSRVVELEPQNNDAHYYRGLTYLIIRDLDKAQSDFETLPQSDTRKSDGLNYVAMFRGEKDTGGLLEFMNNIQTEVGMIPLAVHIGPIPLTSMLGSRVYDK